MMFAIGWATGFLCCVVSVSVAIWLAERQLERALRGNYHPSVSAGPLMKLPRFLTPKTGKRKPIAHSELDEWKREQDGQGGGG